MILIREFIFLFLCETWSSRISRERENILDIIRDAWKGQIFLREWVLQRGIKDPHWWRRSKKGFIISKIEKVREALWMLILCLRMLRDTREFLLVNHLEFFHVCY